MENTGVHILMRYLITSTSAAVFSGHGTVFQLPIKHNSHHVQRKCLVMIKGHAHTHTHTYILNIVLLFYSLPLRKLNSHNREREKNSLMPFFSALTSDQTRYETSETSVHASPYGFLVSSTTQRHACRPGNESNLRKPHLGGISALRCRRH